MDSPLKDITTQNLISILGLAGYQIIDVRQVDAYNGWRLQNEPRGGHIPHAKSLPVKWLKYVDWIETVRHKNILPQHAIIIYGYSWDDAEKVAQRFLSSGYTNVQIYSGFISEWAANDKLPLNKLERHNHLVPASWVNDLIHGRHPLGYNNDKFIIVHAHYRNRDAYLSGHIPGAIDMDTLALEAPETWNRRSP